MITVLRRHLVPESQRRTLEELSADLELRTGDASAKRSAFWTMLALSAVIATAGVLADSTATVIGAMIIAPLSTPIMGIALALVKREHNGSTLFVLAGALAVVLIGAVFAVILPGPRDLLDNSQVSGRVSPGLLDLTAALATGLAGAVALARRDVAAVLPGVAIAISLVPPLAVVGVCLGEGQQALAFGALLLFLSNLVALVLAGTFVFAVLGYAAPGTSGSRRSARVTLALLFLAILLPLGLNSAVTMYVEAWSARIESVAARWVAEVPGASVDGVDRHAGRFRVLVQAPGELPPTDDLLRMLEGEVPDGVGVEVQRTVGETLDVGRVGEVPPGTR